MMTKVILRSECFAPFENVDIGHMKKREEENMIFNLFGFYFYFYLYLQVVHLSEYRRNTNVCRIVAFHSDSFNGFRSSCLILKFICQSISEIQMFIELIFHSDSFIGFRSSRLFSKTLLSYHKQDSLLSTSISFILN